MASLIESFDQEFCAGVQEGTGCELQAQLRGVPGRPQLPQGEGGHPHQVLHQVAQGEVRAQDHNGPL